MSTIPASSIVAVNPNVIGAGGSALDLIAVILSSSTRVPVGTVQSFSTASAVSTYFGAGTPEALAASEYFLGFNTSTVKPGSVLYAQYPTGAVAGYVRGGPGVTLAAVQAIVSGTLAVTRDGVLKTSSALDLSGATSLSNAATLITAAFTSPGFTVTFDSVSGAFVITSATTGVSSTVVVTDGTNAQILKLTPAYGAVTSPGAIAGVPGSFMDAVVAQTQNWASFMTIFEPNTADCIAFAAWNNAQNKRYHYAMWDSDATPAGNTDTSSAGYQIIQAGYEGVSLIYSATYDKAAFLCGAVASLNFSATNGRATLDFKAQSGLTADVTTLTAATNLTAHGYNFYGAYATANQGFSFYGPGSVTGTYLWLDSYINQIWMNNAFQLALMGLLTQVNSVPYNNNGYGLIDAAMSDPIQAAVNFGAIRAGVPLSNLQIAEINAAAGDDVATTLQNRGWYLQILPATSAVRAARGSPPINFWYTDGQSVQKITLSSVEVQ